MKRVAIIYLRLVVFCSAACFFLSCSGKGKDGDIHPELAIIRFDSLLYNYLTDNKINDFSDDNKSFLDEMGRNVLGIGISDSAGFYARLKNYFSDATLMRLYKDEQEKFADIVSINKELSRGMEILSHHFPALKQPKIYMHVSGLNQNVIVSDEFLSLSADKYLGADYPLYQDYFYDYQRQLMTPERMVPDYLLGFMLANFPFKGNNDVLLDKILYEGKLRYILSCLIPKRQVWECTGYNEAQYQWCCEYEARIWKLILENKHLFTSNYLTVEQYINPAPYTASLPVESPGRVGVWLGFRIISSYMKNNPSTSWEELMNFADYKELLTKSKYKP